VTRSFLRFWLVTVAAVAGIAITASLGRWQLSRASQKEALQAAIDTQRKAPALSARDLEPRADLVPLLHRPVVLRGTWIAQHTVFLDNRQMYGRPGFYVLTPLLLEGADRAVVVQRGWVPRNFVDRTQLPEIATPQGLVEITGRIANAPPHLLELGGSDAKGTEGKGASRIRQNLDLAAFRSETGLALADGSVLQTGAGSEGLLRDWPEVGTGVEKHYGYAFQWFGLCALIAFLYVWFQFIAPRRRQRPTT
jgi:surfeit locus 1 family protein